MSEQPLFITAMEFRRRPGIGCLSRAALYEAIKVGRIRSARIGGRVLIPATEIDRLLGEADSSLLTPEPPGS